jgi:predicted RNase H-like nuclease (RuvC/YqgF family)
MFKNIMLGIITLAVVASSATYVYVSLDRQKFLNDQEKAKQSQQDEQDKNIKKQQSSEECLHTTAEKLSINLDVQAKTDGDFKSNLESANNAWQKEEQAEKKVKSSSDYQTCMADKGF